MPSQSIRYPSGQGSRDYDYQPRQRQRISSSLSSTAPLSSSSSNAIRSRHRVSSSTTTAPSMRDVSRSIANQALVERDRYERSRNSSTNNRIASSDIIDLSQPLRLSRRNDYISEAEESSDTSDYDDSFIAPLPRRTDTSTTYTRANQDYFDSLSNRLAQLSMSMNSMGYQMPESLRNDLPTTSATYMPSYTSSNSYSNPFASSSTSGSYPASSFTTAPTTTTSYPAPRISARTYCAMSDDCPQLSDRSSLISIGGGNIHKPCLTNYIAEQILDEDDSNDNILPNNIRALSSYGQNIKWSEVVNAIHGPQRNPTESLSDMNTLASMFLGKAGLIDQMKRRDAEGFIEFAFDAARSMTKDEKIFTGSSRLSKQLLLEMALDKALEIRIPTSLPKISKLLLETTNDNRFVVQGRTMARGDLQDWANGLNLPRGSRRTPDAHQNRNTRNDARVEANMRGNGGSWGRSENAMDEANIRNNIDRFEHIRNGYRPAHISNSRIFEVVSSEVHSYIRRIRAEVQENTRSSQSSTSTRHSSRTSNSRHHTSRTQSSRPSRTSQTNTSSASNTPQQQGPTFTPWNERARRDRIDVGIERCKNDNFPVSRYNGESPGSVLNKLMQYINSPDHSAKKKSDLMDSLCYALEDIGTTTSSGGYVNDCNYGKVGRVMQVPQRIDELDLDTEDLPPEEGTMDRNALNEMLRTDMQNHIEDDELTVQVQIMMQDCERDGIDPDENEETKATFSLLREMFVENMKGKYCIGNTAASEQQVLDVINVIWPTEGLDPSSLIQPLST